MRVALAAAMILMVQVRWDATYDKNFEGHEQVFRMENNWIDQGLFSTHISRPFIETARDASPNIEAVGTISDQGESDILQGGRQGIGHNDSGSSGGQRNVLGIPF